MASLKKSPAEFDEHGDFIDIRFPNRSRSSRNKN
jgi:hypothetical protein